MTCLCCAQDILSTENLWDGKNLQKRGQMIACQQVDTCRNQSVYLLGDVAGFLLFPLLCMSAIHLTDLDDSRLCNTNVSERINNILSQTELSKLLNHPPFQRWVLHI